MKIKIIVFVMLFSFETINAQQNFDMSAINQLVQNLMSQKLHIVESSLDVEAREESQEFQQLENKCKTDWSNIIDNFESIEGGDAARRLVVTAFQALEAKDYMTAIEKVVTRFEAGTVQKSIMLEMIRPAGRMQAFLADNHAHPRVISALNRINAKVSDDADLVAGIHAILNGGKKLALDKFRDAHQDTSEGDIPKVLLAE